MVCFAVLFLDCKGVKNENEIYVHYAYTCFCS